MAQIDSSIYFQQQTPDFLGNFQKGMQLSQIHKENQAKEAEGQKKKAIDSAISGAMKQNPDGSFAFDKNAALSSIGKLGYGADTLDMQNKFQKQDFDNQDMKFKQAKQQLDMTSQLLGGVKDQGTYDNAKAQAQKYGMDVSTLPPQYDPNHINQMMQQTLSYQQQLDNQFKNEQAQYGKVKDERSFGIQEKHNANVEKQTSFDNKVKLATLNHTLNANDGQKTVDKEFAKDYNDWTSGASKGARTEISKLENVLSTLKDGKLQTGGMTGMFPDRMTSNNLLQARSDVQSTVMSSLRSIMGASFTEKEGERVIKNTWNEADSTDNNVARIERLVGDLKNQANDKDSKSKFYEQNKSTLSGYQPVSQTPQQNASQPVRQSVSPEKVKHLKSFSDSQLDKMSPQELALIIRDAKGGK